MELTAPARGSPLHKLICGENPNLGKCFLQGLPQQDLEQGKNRKEPASPVVGESAIRSIPAPPQRAEPAPLEAVASPTSASRPAPCSRSRRRRTPGSRSEAPQFPPQSLRSGQCNSRNRPANCRRNSSSGTEPAGGGRCQGVAAPPMAPTFPASRSMRTVAGVQRLRALLSLPLQGTQSRQLRRQPRAQSPEVWARGSQRRRPRKTLIPAAQPRQREGVGEVSRNF